MEKSTQMNQQNTEMKVCKDSHEESKKIDYEKVVEICNQLHQQNESLKKAVQDMNMSNIIQRLNFLFKVLENKEAFADKQDFLKSCQGEVVELMTFQDPSEASDSEETKS